MKKAKAAKVASGDRDTMRPEYDFSGAARGVTAGRYPGSTNVVTIDPDLRDVFPDAASVNDALRALAPLLRHSSATALPPKARPITTVAKSSAKSPSSTSRRREA